MELVKPDGQAKPAQPVAKLCAISGVFPIPKAVGNIIRGQQEVEFQQTVMGCMGESCMFWQSEHKDCGIALGMKALVELKQSLGALSSFLPKK